MGETGDMSGTGGTGRSADNTIDFLARLRAVLASAPRGTAPRPRFLPGALSGSLPAAGLGTGPGTGASDAPAATQGAPQGAPRKDRDTEILSTHHPVRVRPVLEELETYWRDLRGARRLPVRSDVDPSRIDAALPHAFLIEEVAPGVARLRVAGQRLNALLGMEARGMPLTTFFAHDARAVVAAQLRQVFGRPAIVELPVLSPRALGRPRLSGRLLLLPLGGEPDARRMALGALLVDGMIGTGPRRFEIPGGAEIRCEDVPAAPAPRLKAIAGSHRQVARAETPDDRPRLRLVVSNPPPQPER